MIFRPLLPLITALLALAASPSHAIQVNLDLGANFDTTSSAYYSGFYGPSTFGTTLVGAGQMSLEFDELSIRHYPVNTHVVGIGSTVEDWFVIPLSDVTSFSFSVGKVSWGLSDLTAYFPQGSTLDAGIYLAGSDTTPYAVALTAVNAAGDKLSYGLGSCALQSCVLDADKTTFVLPHTITNRLYAMDTSVTTSSPPIAPAPPLVVPEPGSLALLLGGLLACATFVQRRGQATGSAVAAQ